MTHLLKQAFSKASKLPEVEQNVIARWMIEELASERRWERTPDEAPQSIRPHHGGQVRWTISAFILKRPWFSFNVMVK
ncbi:MAG: hypothetical protein A2901_03895 [Elusimicrobia bacterium RIFCSPLOWO2_01_FULL_54_10]|nr:MAG: hypothetical protein A2901_03895 [Elusimicrobia bacterium RIFCSPLOWO2_01_FULL_54_10]